MRLGAMASGCLAAVLALACFACSPPAERQSGFVDIALETGLAFVHDSGARGEYYFAETMGSGAALFDFDRDGDLDAYLVQGGPLDGPATSPAGLRDGLFRNDLAKSGEGLPVQWVDFTTRAAIQATGYGMGVTSGDVDNDGWVDLYVTNLGDNQLWRNRGDGTFEDASDRLPPEPRWSAGATLVDLDLDGWLDLFVTNYTDFRPATHQSCPGADGRPDYCGPRAYQPVTDRLFLNRGDGTFVDKTAEAGLLTEQATGLGVVATDFDGDGHLDLFVANDQMQNHLWRNGGDGGFENHALITSVAVNAMGRTEASMGVEAADIDNDGDEDLFMTHLEGETNTFYTNQAGATFADGTAASGLGPTTLARTGFGTALVDVDLDGWLDVVVANGAVRVIESQRDAAIEPPLRQPNQLFLNSAAGGFSEASELLPAEDPPAASRGLAAGDVDNDGKPDMLINNNLAAPQLLWNRIPAHAGWIGVDASHPSGRPDLGALVSLRCSTTTSTRRVRTDGSYLSAHDPRVRFGGVGDVGETCVLERRNLAGRRVRWLRPPAYHYLVLAPDRP